MRNDEKRWEHNKINKKPKKVCYSQRSAQICSNIVHIVHKWWFLPALPALRIGSNMFQLSCSHRHLYVLLKPLHTFLTVGQGAFIWCVSWRSAGQIPPSVLVQALHMPFMRCISTWYQLPFLWSLMSFGFWMSFDVLWCPYGNSEYLWIMETQWRPSGVLVRLGGAGVLMMTRSHKTHIETSQPLHISRFLYISFVYILHISWHWLTL